MDIEVFLILILIPILILILILTLILILILYYVLKTPCIKNLCVHPTLYRYRPP